MFILTRQLNGKTVIDEVVGVTITELESDSARVGPAGRSSLRMDGKLACERPGRGCQPPHCMDVK